MFMPNKPWHRVSSGDWKMAQELAAMGTEMPTKTLTFSCEKMEKYSFIVGGFFLKKMREKLHSFEALCKQGK